MEVENQVVETSQNETVGSPPTVEDQAREMGWRPREEYEGDPSKWVDASIFVARAPLFDKIDDQKRHIKTLERGLEALKEHQTKLTELAYQKALKELQDAKKQAAAEGDLERVEEVRDQIQELKEHQATAPEIPKVPEVPQEFQDWQSANPWYKNDEDMRDYADAVGMKLARKGLSPSEVLKQVTEKVRQNFPQKFGNPARQRPSAVDSSSTPPPKKGDDFKLTPEETQVMNKLVAAKVMTKEDYIAEVKKYRG